MAAACFLPFIQELASSTLFLLLIPFLSGHPSRLHQINPGSFEYDTIPVFYSTRILLARIQAFNLRRLCFIRVPLLDPELTHITCHAAFRDP